MSGEVEKTGGSRISRRTLVRAAGWLVAAPVPFLFASMVNRQARLASAPRRVEVAAPAAGGVTFSDDVIVCRSAGATRVFSARCTHLGCRINEVKDDLLICPCHGSRFRLDGTVATGPATRPLEPLPFTTDARTGALIVRVS